MPAGSLTDVRGLCVGHATDTVGITGCTVVLCERGAVGGVDVRGSAAGTRELAALRPEHLAPVVHAVVLAGGSAFGLAAATGVMDYLEERGCGLETPAGRVPIVTSAILYDLAVGDRRARPDAAMGYTAARQATRGPVEEGSVGAGVGATVGKLYGPAQASKGGVGSASMHLGGDVIVAALVVVNAYGDVIDPKSGTVLAGARCQPPRRGFVGMTQDLLAQSQSTRRRRLATLGTNTTLVVIAANAALTKVQATKVAAAGHDGLARTISPAHTMVDGDVVFCLGVGSRRADVDRVAVAGAEVVATATVRAVRIARGEPGGGGLHAARSSRLRRRSRSGTRTG